MNAIVSHSWGTHNTQHTTGMRRLSIHDQNQTDRHSLSAQVFPFINFINFAFSVQNKKHEPRACEPIT